MFYIIDKFQENLSTQFVLKCKSGKNFADFTIFSCVSSHISTLAHRNFTKLTQKLCLIMPYIIAKFQENLSTQFVLKCKSGKNFADFTIFPCVSSHISTLAHRNFTKLTQKLCLIMFYIIAKFQENRSTQFVLKCKSGKNCSSSPLKYLSPNSTFLRKEKKNNAVQEKFSMGGLSNDGISNDGLPNDHGANMYKNLIYLLCLWTVDRRNGT